MQTLLHRGLRLTLLASGAALVVAFTLTGGGRGEASMQMPQLKVALVAPSAHNDLAFTQSMYAALKRSRRSTTSSSRCPRTSSSSPTPRTSSASTRRRATT